MKDPNYKDDWPETTYSCTRDDDDPLPRPRPICSCGRLEYEPGPICENCPDYVPPPKKICDCGARFEGWGRFCSKCQKERAVREYQEQNWGHRKKGEKPTPKHESIFWD